MLLCCFRLNNAEKTCLRVLRSPFPQKVDDEEVGAGSGEEPMEIGSGLDPVSAATQKDPPRRRPLDPPGYRLCDGCYELPGNDTQGRFIYPDM